MKQALKINPADNVAVAIQDLKKGTAIDIDGQALTLQTDVPAGHKLALCEIKKDENVIKYGFPIGHALHDIAPGVMA
jgi:altronate hydrolase